MRIIYVLWIEKGMKKNRHKQYLKKPQNIVDDRSELNQFKYSSKLIIDKTKTVKLFEK